ncbi:MAG: disulfide bond formation protein DsbD, partial [Sandaracinaceae bacterium]|nr:disulfide bond formation protein DsbD [Sandaracinaceae bacterium]
MRSRAAAAASPFLAPLVAGVLLTGCTSSDDLTAQFEQALGVGNWSVVLGIAFVFGLGTSLTPCVYPMIGITVSVFGASEAKTKLHGAFLSTMYVLGICTLFTTLGLGFGLGGGVFGSFLASPWVLIPLALLFVVLASSMFGAFELSLPPSLQNRLAQMGGLGPKGAFVLGLVGGLIAAPCTGPVLGALLAWIGSTGNAGLGAASLFVYGLGLGLPTWIVGTFAISLPKSGRWLEWTKSTMGIGLVVAALWFLRDVPRAFVVTFELHDYVHRTPLFLGVSAALIVAGIA